MTRLRRALLAAILPAALIAGCGGSAHKQHSTARVAQYNASVHPSGWGAPLGAGFSGHAADASAPVPTATMYDTVTLSTVPPAPFALAGYTSGFWPTYLPLRRAYPAAHTISIAINASHHADCLDVEPGDATPAQAPAWVRADIAAGFAHPCVYSSLWMYLNQVRPALAAAGIQRSQVFEWDANYTLSDHLDAGFDATQWTDRCLGRNLDCSRVTLPFLSIATPPLIPKSPGPTDATISHWQQQRNSGFDFYRSNGCTAPQSKPQPYCSHFAAQVVSYQRKLWTVPRAGFHRWTCFGRHARTRSLVCWIVRGQAGWYSHGRALTQRAEFLNGCDGPVGSPHPVHSALCDKLRQRENWFAAQASAVVKAYT